jgi:hypothetical protein
VIPVPVLQKTARCGGPGSVHVRSPVAVCARARNLCDSVPHYVPGRGRERARALHVQRDDEAVPFGRSGLTARRSVGYCDVAHKRSDRSSPSNCRIGPAGAPYRIGMARASVKAITAGPPRRLSDPPPPGAARGSRPRHETKKRPREDLSADPSRPPGRPGRRRRQRAHLLFSRRLLVQIVRVM